MRRSVSALLACAGIVFASQAVFSVHDDLLAFPQYELVFSNLFISDIEAYEILAHTAPAQAEDYNSYDKEFTSDSKSISSQRNHGQSAVVENDTGKQTYEWMRQDGKRYLCSIPVIETPPRNETSEAEARAEEAQEIARATDRGWELLQELDGPCLYYISGYWSYSFCHNSEVKQFRQLPAQQGKPVFPPTEDPNVNSFILGKSLDEASEESGSKQDEWGNQVDVRKAQKASPPTTELQMEGDTRYLVQKLDGGTTCDLTGKPRRTEVQYHCNPNGADRINRLKEITTCSYLLTIHTPRLCKDLAFVPPTATEANRIICQQVLPQDQIANLDLSTLEAVEQTTKTKEKEKEKQIIIGGTVVGGKKHVGKDGQVIGNAQLQNPAAEIIAKALGEADGGQVTILSDDALLDRDLDPTMVEEFRKKMKEMAGERGWVLEVVEGPDHVIEIHGIVDSDGEDENEEGEGGEEEDLEWKVDSVKEGKGKGKGKGKSKKDEL